MVYFQIVCHYRLNQSKVVSQKRKVAFQAKISHILYLRSSCCNQTRKRTFPFNTKFINFFCQYFRIFFKNSLRYRKGTEPFISFFYVLICFTSFRYLSITCNAFIACYIICSKIYAILKCKLNINLHIN